MNAWGVETFENDAATGFAREAMEDGPVALAEAFDVVLDAEGELEAPEGARALAAAELLVAALSGEYRRIPDAELVGWLRTQDPDALRELVPLAAVAVDRVLDEHSELYQHRSRLGDWAAWLTSVRRLRDQLNELMDG